MSLRPQILPAAKPGKEAMQSDTSQLLQKLAPDRTLAEPVYKQLARRVTDLIAAGEITVGQSLPSERVLAERLDISRSTVRRFFDELRSQNILVSQGRAGASIHALPRLSPSLGTLKGFTDEMRELGIEPATRLLEREIVQDRLMASVFNRPSTTNFLRLVRLRFGDGTPLSREVAWYDLSIAPEMAEWDVVGSAYAFLRETCNLRLGSAEQTIEAVESSPIECKVFGFDGKKPCLLMKRKTFTGLGQIVEYVEGTFRGDAYAYRLTLTT
jgi:GntR family transcriptional regulator